MVYQTGILLCSCGPNISEAVDLQAITEEFSGRDGVAWVQRFNLPCSKGERGKVAQHLKDHPVDRLVVGGCSPKQHEKTFQACMGEAGMNPYFLQFANLREHCAWMGSDKSAATAKAMRLMTAALARVQRHEPIELRTMKVHAEVLVIGAGVAGMEAAILMAREGRTVHLIDRSPSIGGMVPLLSELYPSMECSSCAIEPMMDEVLHHKNIRLHLLTELRSVRGYFGNFHVALAKRPRYVKSESCMGCGMCIEACPADIAPSGRGETGRIRPIRNSYQGALPNAPLIDRTRCAPSAGDSCAACAAACPVGAIELDAREAEEAIEVGAIVVAAGADEGAPRDCGACVFTAYEFERMANAGGPTAGAVVLPSGEKPRSVAIVAVDTHSASGRLITMNAAKYALIALERLPQAEIVLYLRDPVIASAEEHERWDEINRHKKARIERIDRAEDIFVNRSNGSITLKATGAERVDNPDLVILCEPLRAPASAADVAALLGLELSDGGFFKAAHPLLDPVSTAIRGIFAAGSATGPKSVSEAVTHGKAVAGNVLSVLRPGAEIELNPCTSFVNQDLCSGCESCVSVCSYRAVVKDDEGRIVVEEALCQGCGVCASACPSGAMQTKHFKLDQILAEVDALCLDKE